ncbi:hypothetical protein MYCTH_2058513 [Thermothelomyces thermophilus ATCC 42464]|uniref:Uncharacterized protein n=1 Tax=Thermothelomyces thermophilus (strain ATCC 42464 / BCRC 31852 / DSM 1799) TaxID=573729 RepID=G2Q9F8_THET4|nr:uncharacterized protein MYCTH_2058513 [Thermothelomyces thermophilus ATCC 42464]AEO56417.1 hypothetical protein MYCTH_2058513 [Thermothelomyces thermophilus ATCC 42464]
MSRVDQQQQQRPFASVKAARPTNVTDSQALDGNREFRLSSKAATFDEPIFDRFEDMDNQDTLIPSPNPGLANDDEVPQLPPKSALRRSKVLGGLGLSLGGAGGAAAGLGQATTPHDVYLSSEEDASSDADDFSDHDYDYDYDSSVEDPTSPTRGLAHEGITARVVSVVFSGKPSIVDLPVSRRRPLSGSSLATTRTRSSSDSSAAVRRSTAASTTTTTTTSTTITTTTSHTAEDRPISPVSTVSSRHSRLSKDGASHNRRGSLLSEVLVKKKPPFLSIDPYANGSGPLEIPKALDSLEGETRSAKAPRTPTTLLKGVTRSLSLSRRRSRPSLSSPQTAVPKLDTSLTISSPNPNRHSSYSSYLSPTTEEEEAPACEQQEQQWQQQQSQHLQQHLQPQQHHHQQQEPKTPMTPVAYTDILRAVKRSATVVGAPSPPSDIMSPTEHSPATARRGILSGLSVRRRSVKVMGKPN